MSREIKFRAWVTADKRLRPTMYQDRDMSLVFKLNNKGGFEKYHAEDYILMQFTGLLDENGVEIYEGDIVTTGNGLRRLVIWDAPGFWLAKNTTDIIDVDSFSTPGIYEEVIGNIYENPELLTPTQIGEEEKYA